jgi:hypothetical protein
LKGQAFRSSFSPWPVFLLPVTTEETLCGILPRHSADSVLKGEEIISFVVNQKGKISSIKVIQSVSPAHDAEVIRLLKSGPGLQTTNGKKQKCRISIFFN